MLRAVTSGALLAVIAITAGCAMTGGDGSHVAYVDTFDIASGSCGLGKSIRARLSVDGHPLKMGGVTYGRGFGTHPESALCFSANGNVRCFDAMVGLDADAKEANRYGRAAAVAFRVWADGKVVWSSPQIKEGEKPIPVHVNLCGAREIVLETRSGVRWYDFHGMNADWADARFTCDGDAELAALDDRHRFRQDGILTPPEKPAPQFNGADIWGVRPGHPVIFRVPVSGKRPMTFSAQGLPTGVTFDSTRGILGGVAPDKTGDYDIRVSASNACGMASRTIRLAVGDRLALTPPMGWNSWNIWGWLLTQKHAEASVDAMERSGLGDYGWAYVNLDDWWQHNNKSNTYARWTERVSLYGDDVSGAPRSKNGTILPNRSFPDMKRFADLCHAHGFKAGLYSSPGPLTCGLCEGSLGHEREDAAAYAKWGFDFLKYDWCSYNRLFMKETGLKGWGGRAEWDNPKFHEAYVRPYRLMYDALRSQNRDIFFAYCQYGMGGVESWGRGMGANSWRSSDDLKDLWPWMEEALEANINGEFWKYSGPGCWADPDMMIIGDQRSFGTRHGTFLTPNEQYVHVSLWAMVGSPLLIGCDLTALDAFTRNLLVNREVIAISQDRLGKVARRYLHTDAESVWARPLVDGDWAVAIVNRYPLSRIVSLDLPSVVPELGGHFRVRDCWTQSDLGKISGSIVSDIPAHGVRLLRLKPIACPRCE